MRNMISRILFLALISITLVQAKPFVEFEALKEEFDDQLRYSSGYDQQQKRIQKRDDDYGELDGKNQLHVDYDAEPVDDKKIEKKKGKGYHKIHIHIHEDDDEEEHTEEKGDMLEIHSKKGKQSGKEDYVRGFLRKINTAVSNGVNKVLKSGKSIFDRFGK